MRPQPLMAARRPDLLERTIDRSKGVARPVEPIPQSGPIDYSLIQSLFGQTTTPQVFTSVSETNIGGLPALERGVDMVANAVATMLVHAEVLDETDTPIADRPRPNVLARPATLLGTFEFFHQAVHTVMKRGNYIGLLADFDEDGYARQVIPVHPDMVTLDQHTIPGVPLYRIGKGVFTWLEVVHVRSHAPSGTLWGQGIVERFRRHLSLQLHEAEYARNSYLTGGVPSAVIQLDVPEITQEIATTTKQAWIDTFGNGAREPAIVGRTFKEIRPLSWSPKDADWVNGAQLSIAQCAYMAGLRPEDLGAAAGGSGGMTYGNRTDDSLQRVTDSYNPWMELFEQAWSDLLPIGETVRGNVEALLRTSTKERYEVHALAQSIGLETPEETRVINKRQPAPTTEA